MDRTISDIYAKGIPQSSTQRRSVLYVAMQLDDPAMAPSRHCVDDVAIITLGRGDRATIRRDIDDRPGLEIRIPDPVMSSSHATLVRDDGAWRLEDPTSKNGTIVDGRPTRRTRIVHGAVIQVGHTILLFDQATFSGDTAPDFTATPLPPPLSELVTLDPSLAACFADLRRVAPSDALILLLGDTGTGKEVAAQAIHALSHREGEFVVVHCGAIPESLIESELFGHKKGSFTGALADRPGHLRAADRGTLFLDEVGELSFPAQTALLRALQQHVVVPVGESHPVPVDLRIIAATNRDLAAMVREQRFREDLYSRLRRGVSMRLPPLRDRQCDLGILIRALLRRIDPANRLRLTPSVARALFAHTWPRNIRELEGALVGARDLSDDGLIDLRHLPDDIAPCGVTEVPVSDVSREPLTPDDEKLSTTIIDALTRRHGNVTHAAKDLGIHREQVYRWVYRFGIDLGSFRRR